MDEGKDEPYTGEGAAAEASSPVATAACMLLEQHGRFFLHCRLTLPYT